MIGIDDPCEPRGHPHVVISTVGPASERAEA